MSSLRKTFLLGNVMVQFCTVGKGDGVRQDSMLIYEIAALERVWKYFFSPVCCFLRCDKSNRASELFAG